MKILKGILAVVVSFIVLLAILGIRLITLFWGDTSAPEIEISDIEEV